ncbi:MAG: helix-turn-helix domain-containing protein [Vagococcus sp.]
MRKYKVVLADDEAEILEGMAKKVNWDALGFELVGLAENGIMALDYIEMYRPDVLITDVQMPFLNGLELIEKAVEFIPKAKIVVFSGYDLFEYAQKAVSLHASSYLLKPFSAKQLEKELIKLKEEMDAEWEEKRNVQLLEERYQQSFDIIRQNFLIGCIGGYVSKEGLASEGRKFNLGKNGNLYTIGLIKTVNETTVNKKGSIFENREELIPLAVQKIVHSVFTHHVPYYDFVLGDYLVLVVEVKKEEDVDVLIGQVNEVCRESREIIGKKFLSGIGNYYTGLEHLKTSYKEAKIAFEYSFLLDQKWAYTTYYKDVSLPKKEHYIDFEESDQRLLGNVIEFGNTRSIKDYFTTIFNTINVNHFSSNGYKIYIIEIITTLMKLLNTYRLENESLIYDALSGVQQELNNYSLEEIKKQLIAIAISMSEDVKSQTMDSTESIVKKAKLYIEDHYQDATLSVEDVSSVLYLSPTYFSTLFKKEAGISFVSYLNDTRLEIAAELLIKTTKKTYQIAEEVGYSEANYFSYVFKRKYHLPPTKYRREFGSEEAV